MVCVYEEKVNRININLIDFREKGGQKSVTLNQAWLDGKTIKLVLLWQEGELDDVSDDLRWGL